MKLGDVVKVVRITGTNGYVLGKRYVICAPYTGGNTNGITYWQLRDVETNIVNTNWVAENDLTIYAFNRKSLEEKLKESELEVDRNKKMLEYLDEQQKEEVDSIEFFAWYIVKIMESTDPRKTEKVSKLLNTVTNHIDIEKIMTR
jgi:hypothetical protein